MENKIKFTKEDLAMIEKWTHPEKKVVCPLCGKELLYEEAGASASVECPTKGCCEPLTIRGL